MTELPFSIAFQRDRRRMHISMFGLWDLAEVQHYETSVVSMTQDILRSGLIRQFDVLVDLRHHPIQPREVAEALQRVIGRLRDGVARVAVVTSNSSLHKLQAARLDQSAHTRFFASIEDADSWLSA